MVKVISLSEEAYARLKNIKRDRSFSEVVIELSNFKPKGNIMSLFGVLKDDADEWDKIKSKIYSNRKKFKIRSVSF